MQPTMDTRAIAEAIAWQADHAANNGAPCTGRVVRAQLALLDGATRTGAAIAHWPGKPLEDALPLRLAGGHHALALGGAEARLWPVYRGEVTDQAEVDRIVAAVTRDHDAALLPWLDGPPQTNEAGRSASIMAALLWLSPRLGARFELNELGASAGINTMMERFAFDLGGTLAGPADSPLRIVPEWRGPAPLPAPVEITEIRGCDRAPLDLTDPATALRLRAYVWAEVTERLARLEAAVTLATQRPPLLDRADAADWVEARLAEPQEDDTTRVFFHSIVWQYLPEPTRERITRAIEAAGARADARRRLAWVRLETNRATFRHELTVRFWQDPSGVGHGEPVLLGTAHAHGAWVEWFGQDEARA